jgi:hypothetical protein
MAICLADLEPLKLNPHASILVGRIPESIAAHFNWKARNVYLKGERLAHILAHPDMVELDVLYIPNALASGLLLQELDRPDSLIACYQHPEIATKRFKAAVKVLDNGFEIWISTFHRTHARQTKALLARSHKLRDHL